MKTGAAFNQQNDYRPSVSNVKGILQKKCKKFLWYPSRRASSFKFPVRSYKLKDEGGSVRLCGPYRFLKKILLLYWNQKAEMGKCQLVQTFLPKIRPNAQEKAIWLANYVTWAKTPLCRDSSRQRMLRCNDWPLPKYPMFT